MAFVLPREEVINNDAFRRVLYTDSRQQYVAMALPPSSGIGVESHRETQTVIVYDGRGVAALGNRGQRTDLMAGTAVLVNGGTLHDFIADPNSWLRILVIYSPPKHESGLVQDERPITRPSSPNLEEQEEGQIEEEDKEEEVKEEPEEDKEEEEVDVEEEEED